MASRAVPAILHVGMPKCGSSALQAALSQHHLSNNYRYTVIRENADVISGEKLNQLANTSATGYIPSVSSLKIDQWDNEHWQACRKRLFDLAGSKSTLVLSNEAWGNQSAQFAKMNILRRLGLEADIIMYVRPQLQWLNSAWWQWGAWTGQPFEDWLKINIVKADWYDAYESWLVVPGVNSVTVRLLPSDVVTDFYHLIKQAAPDVTRTNTSLPGYLLRFFQQHKDLRGGPHNSEIEFVVARHVELPKEPTPWVLNKDHVLLCLRYYQRSNQQLLKVLPDEQQQEMENSAAWWSSEFYNSYMAHSPHESDLHSADVEQIAKQAMLALVALDRSHRQLQRRYDQLQHKKLSTDSCKYHFSYWWHRLTRNG
ncbi:hypothetical protein K7H08_03460 [Halomonas sp. IOP_6]|uniref:hypothetical protein n=1 Tax=Halomonas sp. IOP_6 TaxID=2876583 RepID=UPI001E65A8C6|nr:hypothetical protein [Halomonas sp. IOP_6]MCD6003892.1 hypothetical protein [Halomonas sp. IOP_6]